MTYLLILVDQYLEIRAWHCTHIQSRNTDWLLVSLHSSALHWNGISLDNWFLESLNEYSLSINSQTLIGNSKMPGFWKTQFPTDYFTYNRWRAWDVLVSHYIDGNWFNSFNFDYDVVKGVPNSKKGVQISHICLLNQQYFTGNNQVKYCLQVSV